MYIPVWVLIILAIVAVIVWLLIIQDKDKKKRFSCVTCGLTYSNQDNLLKCDKCGFVFCDNNFEAVINNSSSSHIHIDVAPATRTPKASCGSVMLRNNELEHTYCKLHAPNIGRDYSINEKK